MRGIDYLLDRKVDVQKHDCTAKSDHASRVGQNMACRCYHIHQIVNTIHAMCDLGCEWKHSSNCNWERAFLVLVNKGGNGSQGDYERRASADALGSALSHSASHDDCSGKAMVKMTYSMALVLERKDQEIIQDLEKCSIALDERDQILLIFLRVLTKKGQIYECLLGLARDYGTGPANCLKAIEAVMREKCTRKQGRRKIPHYDKGEGDKFDAELFNKLRNGNTSIASDSGPTEMKAAFEACPTAKDPANRADPLFPNNRYIFRDAAHRHRSVQQGFWNDIDKPLREFLSALIDGPHSFAKFVGDSRKFSLCWESTQREMKLGTFADVLRNLGYAKQRFDSRSRPLFILFKMLGGPSTYVFFMCFAQWCVCVCVCSCLVA